MIERSLTISQARNLLRTLTERSQAHLLRLGEQVSGVDVGPRIVPENGPITQRLLEFIRDHADQPNPRIRVRLFMPDEEISAGAATKQQQRHPLSEEQALETRARGLSDDVGSDAAAVSDAIDQLHEILSVPDTDRETVLRPSVKAALAEVETALRAFRQSTHIALEEFLENRNPFVLDLVKEYKLDADSARHGLQVATFAAELTAHLGEDLYLGKSPSDERLRHELFHRELVEIFLGGFLHDIGTWGGDESLTHNTEGAGIAARIPHISVVSESMVDIVLFHSDLAFLAGSPGVLRLQRGRDSHPQFSAEYHDTVENARTQIADLADTVKAKLVREQDLKRILPVAIAEHFVTRTEGSKPASPAVAISEAVSFCGNEIYTMYMIPLCNSQAGVVAPRRSLVALAGHLPIGHSASGERLNLDGDVGITVSNDGPQAPLVVRLSTKGPDGKLIGLRPIPPENPVFGSRSDPGSYAHIPVGRIRDVSVSVVGIMGRNAYDKRFGRYEAWVRQQPY